MDSPKRWEKICDWLNARHFEAMGRVSRRPYELQDGWEKVTVRLFEIEQQTALEADSAARFAATRGDLPDELSSDAALLLVIRCQCAMDFLGMLFPPQSLSSPLREVPSGWSDAQVKAWLLVDLWQRRHDHWLKLYSLGACGPFPFYGLTPADPDGVA